MRVATSSQQLKLAPHVRVCESDGQVILLDLRHSRYLGVGAAASAALAGRVTNWPTRSELTDIHPTSAAVGKFTQRLVLNGLLTNAPIERVPQVQIEEATASLDFADLSVNSAIGARRLARFLKSAALAALWLRLRSLDSIVTAVAGRRARLSRANSECPEAMREAAAAYEWLRPFVFTAQEKCLHDSLALMNFLATEGLFPRWVIGVKTGPFGAHSWVQSGETVLNDQHEHVRRFRPILVV